MTARDNPPRERLEAFYRETKMRAAVRRIWEMLQTEKPQTAVELIEILHRQP